MAFLVTLAQFGSDERGQDLVEYTLIVAVIVVLAAVLFNFNQDSMDAIWTRGGGVLDQARSGI